MPKLSQDAYDAVIIGAGIGGLVCGCYLAKAGMKVLIAEQHHKPGGYCTSFKRQGFTFDAAAHSVGGFNYGNLGKIFRDLGMHTKLTFRRHDPSNVVLDSDGTIAFWSDLSRTIEDIQSAFPREQDSIKSFFDMIMSADKTTSLCMKNRTFGEVLDVYFKDGRLKASLSFPLFGNSGLPPSRLSAFIGLKIFREFLLDGGYSPDGGMQKLSDALSQVFMEAGGELLYSAPVKMIRLQEKEVRGIILTDKRSFDAKYVVSNCDARQTFLQLVGGQSLTNDFMQAIDELRPSLSMFIVYLGLANNDFVPYQGSNLWVLNQHDLGEMYVTVKKGLIEGFGGYLIHSANNTVTAFMNAPYKDENFWSQLREELTDRFIEKIEKDAIPGLSQQMVYKASATPHTLNRYTLNSMGAAYGWECIPSQVALPDFRKPSFVRNLFLAGHWTTTGLGIPGVVYIGYDTAKMIIRREERTVCYDLPAKRM